MFKTILVPTDGSDLSKKAAEFAVQFAQQSGARIVALAVAEPYPFDPLPEAGAASFSTVYGDRTRGLATLYVKEIADAARAANVPCEPVVTVSSSPHEEIIDTAARLNCDAIFMASHGRKGLNKLLLGSQTQRVLAHAALPVLVLR